MLSWLLKKLNTVNQRIVQAIVFSFSISVHIVLVTILRITSAYSCLADDIFLKKHKTDIAASIRFAKPTEPKGFSINAVLPAAKAIQKESSTQKIEKKEIAVPKTQKIHKKQAAPVSETQGTFSEFKRSFSPFLRPKAQAEKIKSADKIIKTKDQTEKSVKKIEQKPIEKPADKPIEKPLLSPVEVQEIPVSKTTNIDSDTISIDKKVQSMEKNNSWLQDVQCELLNNWQIPPGFEGYGEVIISAEIGHSDGKVKAVQKLVQVPLVLYQSCKVSLFKSHFPKELWGKQVNFKFNV
jgi:hypothetical protein